MQRGTRTEILHAGNYNAFNLNYWLSVEDKDKTKALKPGVIALIEFGIFVMKIFAVLILKRVAK